MRHFKDKIEFEKEMRTIEDILYKKGYVLESDHPYAYAMQYGNAFEDVKEWLIDNGYEGELQALGTFDGVAVYGLYDTTRITYEEMLKKLLDEAAQNTIAY